MTDWCITLRPDGEDQWVELQPVADYRSLERNQVLDMIRDAGIAGLGGAGFPPTSNCARPGIVWWQR